MFEWSVIFWYKCVKIICDDLRLYYQLGCGNKIWYRLGVFKNIYFSWFWSLGSPGLKCQQIHCLVKTLFMVCRWLSSYCIVTWQGKERASSLLIRTLIPSWRLQIHDLITSQRPPSQWYHIRASTYELGHTNIQFMRGLWNYPNNFVCLYSLYFEAMLLCAYKFVITSWWLFHLLLCSLSIYAY